MAKSTSLSEKIRASSWGNMAVLLVIVALVAAGAWVATRGSGSAPSRDDGQASGAYSRVSSEADAHGAAPEVGKAAPALTGTDVTGAPFSLTGHRGRPVWVIFNATWCSACRAEAPDIEAVAHAGDIDVVTVYRGEQGETITDFASRMGLSTPTAVPDPDERISTDWRVWALPTHIFIDADGIVQTIRTGQLSPSDARALVAGTRTSG
ncbi:TlpA family protein disulfide reductase [Nanchangia anserum]|uniref:TlpA family protein disulfide reductase n=1 Tax=Nanchangia anserum TaxID=2692125 RepID=A0A8I0G909_9ACTO|nr:TlpA disulfide reductase family protein [Nanchangia anserum]MBD3690150.1 TlpA family protein disulfide reductase [Nanchangia anserum]QOX82071.1 TlpA family protein disulfide reductase [Nanchangia anserum]